MKAFSLLGLLLLSFLAIDCSNKSSKNTLELAIWGSAEEKGIVSLTLREFKKTHPDVTVKLTHIANAGAYVDKILARGAANDLPDIMFMEVNMMDRLMDKGYLLDISQKLATDAQFKEADYFQTLIQRFRKNGALYGLPRDVAPFAVVYYNKQLFDKAGIKHPNDDWNVNDFLKAAKALTKRNKDGKVEVYGFNTWIWPNYLYAFGGKMVDNIDNPTRCLIGSPEAVAGVTFYRDLMTVHKVMPAPGQEDRNSQDLFMGGNCAMYLSGIWETPALRAIQAFDWDVAMFPKGPKGQRGFATGGSGYGISRITKNQDLAWELLKSIAGEYGQKQNAQKGLAQPALIKLAEGPLWAQDKVNKPMNKGMVNEAVNYIVYNPRHPNWSEIDQKLIGPAIDLIVRNEADPKNKLAEVARQADELLMKK